MRKTLSLGESIRGSRATATAPASTAGFIVTANTAAAMAAQTFSVKAHPSRVNLTGSAVSAKGRPAPARDRLTSRMASVDVSNALDAQSGPVVKFIHMWAKSPLVIECGPAGQRCIALRTQAGGVEIQAGLIANEGLGAQKVRWVALSSVINTPGFRAWRSQSAWLNQRPF